MAWTSPRTWVATEVVTAALMNTHLRDNLTALRGGGLAVPSQVAGDWLKASSAAAWERCLPYTPYLVVNTTPGGNVGTGVDTLQSYQLATGLLGTDGWGIEIEAVVRCAANSNNKQAWIYFGATAVAATTVNVWNSVAFVLRARVIRTGATAQVAFGETLVTGSTAMVTTTYAAPAETLANAITITVKGEATSNDDVQSAVLAVRLFHA